jgi:hypothetical protein
MQPRYECRLDRDGFYCLAKGHMSMDPLGYAPIDCAIFSSVSIYTFHHRHRPSRLSRVSELSKCQHSAAELSTQLFVRALSHSMDLEPCGAECSFEGVITCQG